MIHGHKCQDVQGGGAGGENKKTQSSGDLRFICHKNRIHGKQKAAPTDGFTRIIWRKFFFTHDIPLSLQQVMSSYAKRCISLLKIGGYRH